MIEPSGISRVNPEYTSIERSLSLSDIARRGFANRGVPTKASEKDPPCVGTSTRKLSFIFTRSQKTLAKKTKAATKNAARSAGENAFIVSSILSRRFRRHSFFNNGFTMSVILYKMRRGAYKII
jgi:hypothetical protein